MNKTTSRSFELPDALIDAVLNQSPVEEAPHNFYKYPARFSPTFAREAIRAFTDVGDTVIDCFNGGGTTVLEGMGLGRRVVGTDISTLATFIANTKATPISSIDSEAIKAWCQRIACQRPDDCNDSVRLPEPERDHYERNVPGTAMGFFSWIIAESQRLKSERQRSFVRLVLLSVGQRALDCKNENPNACDLRDLLTEALCAATEKHLDFFNRVSAATGMSASGLHSLHRVINRDAQAIDPGDFPKGWLPAKLVVTSPPYPGVHVVYHRWQVDGRKETPVPFWIANQRDGAGESFYTLGSRKELGLKKYFNRLQAVFQSIRPLLAEDAKVVQLVAFSDPSWQLPAYLSAMCGAGFTEMSIRTNAACASDGRIWRQVPGRKWYAKNCGNISASNEALLVHCKS